jgi:regulator of ribosome biosynthesis
MDLAQAMADILFALPPNENRDGPMVCLLPPTTHLSSEKTCKKTSLLSTIY